MVDRIPEGITREHLIEAIEKIQVGFPNKFAASTSYDVLHQGKRYPPKAVVGVAATKVLGEELGPADFKGGLQSRCFKVLATNGFEIVTKGDTNPFPDTLEDEVYNEGGSVVVRVNRYERDLKARKKCIEHYGAECRVCRLDFESQYGTIGEGFIHVHHTIPIASIGESYELDPIKSLVPVCPNCHAMLHKRQPPFTVDELKVMLLQGG
jgi:5-methylcytosine-specific restriction protein A